MLRGHPLRSATFSLGVAGFLTISLACGGDDEQFREEVFLCEEALARLVQCCPGFVTSTVRCIYSRSENVSGCKVGRNVNPSLDVPTSMCIIDTECSAIRDRNICGRASGNAPGSADAGTSTPVRRAVCP